MFNSFQTDLAKALDYLPQSIEVKLADIELSSLALLNKFRDHSQVVCVFDTSAKAESSYNELRKYQDSSLLAKTELLHYPEPNSDQVEYDIDLERSRTLSQLLSYKDGQQVLICSIASLLKAVTPPSLLNSQSLSLKVADEQFSPEQLCHVFTEMGFDNEMHVSYIERIN